MAPNGGRGTSTVDRALIPTFIRCLVTAWKRIALHTFRDRLEQLSKLVGTMVDVAKEWCCNVGQTIF